MNIKSLLSFMIVSVLATACVSMGPNFDPAAVSSLRPGMSRSDVEKVLGKPTTVLTSSDGSSQITWIHSKGSMMGATAHGVTLLFAADSRLVKTMNQVETRTHL